MKINHCYDEEDIVCIESRLRNEELKSEFDEVYKLNCQRTSKKLSNVENTKMFLSGYITRLIWPPKTHHGDCLKQIGFNLYVNIKKQ